MAQQEERARQLSLQQMLLRVAGSAAQPARTECDAAAQRDPCNKCPNCTTSFLTTTDLVTHLSALQGRQMCYLQQIINNGTTEL